MKQYCLTLIIIFFSTSTYAEKSPGSRFRVYVDERMELLTTVQFLADYTLLTKADINYKKEVENFFIQYKEHPLIPLTKAMIEGDYFTGSAAPWFLYQFSFPAFEPAGLIKEEENQIEDYHHRMDTLNLFLTRLKDFYTISHFNEFYIQHISFYDSITTPVYKELVRKDIPALLENHYGEKKRSYQIILSPLLHDGGYGLQVHTPEGQDIYGIIGPAFNSPDYPVFDTEQIMSYYVIHEFSHSFCNPVISAHFGDLNAYSCLIQPIMSEQIKQGYGGDWETCLYEHLVRANEVVLSEQIFGTEKANRIYNEYYENKKWIYLKELVSLIKNEYLSDRTTYKTLHDLMPLVVAFFKKEKMKTCPQ